MCRVLHLARPAKTLMCHYRPVETLSETVPQLAMPSKQSKISYVHLIEMSMLAYRDTESMTPEIPDPVLVETIGPQSSGGNPSDKTQTESACATDELFTDPFQVAL